jgi:hypothetical protein
MRHLSGLLTVGILGATCFIPRLVRADTPVIVVNEPPPEQGRDQVMMTTTNTPVIVSRALTFGLAYGIAAMAAATSENSADERLYVPLLGPWLDLADRPNCAVSDSACDRETTKKILIGADGVFQAIGVTVVVYGILTPRHHMAGDDSMRVVPVSMGNGARGLALTGSF